MPSLDLRESHTREILSRLEADGTLSQRSLSRDLGIALGLTNLLLRQMTRKGLVRLRKVKPNRVRYLITPAGIAEKTRLSRNYLRRSVQYYAEVRDRMQHALAVLAAQPARDGASPVRVIFWGAGEEAEIAYLCLQHAGLRLCGIVDDERRGRMLFGHPVLPSSAMRGHRVGDAEFDALVVVSIDEDGAAVEHRLQELGVEGPCIFWINADHQDAR